MEQEKEQANTDSSSKDNRNSDRDFILEKLKQAGIPVEYRTDKHNNPTAFTTDLAKEAGLVEGVDYNQGESFAVGKATMYTARLLNDPLLTTVKLIDKVGFYTKKGGFQRWIYIALPNFIWFSLDYATKVRVIGFMYNREGGKDMQGLFSVMGKPIPGTP